MIDVVVFGRTGQLGQELARLATSSGLTMRGLTREDVDLPDGDAVARVISRSNCALVVNATAYTDVDKAEHEPEQAFAINRDAPRLIAETCATAQIPMLHISTDYVFDGTKDSPYVETDAVAPLGIYGASKAVGEEAVRTILRQHVIVRTSWLFSAHGRNFVKTVLRLAEEREEIAIVDDQRGCPTPARDLAAVVLEIARQILQKRRTDVWGTYHFAGRNPTTWFEFARTIVGLRETLLGLSAPRVRPITTAEYPTEARRPANSVLNCTKIQRTYGVQCKHWHGALSEVIIELLGERE